MAEDKKKAGAGAEAAPVHKGRGGARPGAGRKAKWGEKTVVMRVPLSMREQVEEFLTLRAQGVELLRSDEVETRVAQAVEQTLAQAQAAGVREAPATVPQPAAEGAPEQAVAAVVSQAPQAQAAEAAQAKPKKPRAPRKKAAPKAGAVDPERQGSLFDLL